MNRHWWRIGAIAALLGYSTIIALLLLARFLPFSPMEHNWDDSVFKIFLPAAILLPFTIYAVVFIFRRRS